ncbi:methyltransferase [Spiroplasma sp. TIUS-1]|uniref:class I SAM-dependent methyltransferase n=1 Tax=Spiroplasma sp. TIUS-1 TaxID=216963 RepID=UPI001398A403|nr:class I SAM-dependent methyltransferase [Spiroplasma sp. TIUS-1]QHX35847.1 methyltransferase [Spiroplasma sp. TIUS-1]
MNKNNYSSLSSIVYDFTKPPGTNSDGDIEFYKSYLLPLEGKILEAGVGNGRMSIPLLKYGLSVDGIDISKEMLDIYKYNLDKQKLSGKIINMNLKEYVSDNYYEAIIMPTGSVCMIEEVEDLKIILNNFYKSLSNNGFILIDFIYPTTFKPGSYHKTNIQLDSENSIELNINHKSIDWSKQVAYSTNQYIQFQNGKEIKTEIQNFNLRWYSENEIKMLAEKAGYKSIELIKNYNKKRVLNLNTITLFAKK